MPSVHPNRAEGLLRRARSDLESGLRGGADSRAESFLLQYPDVARDPEAALELVYTEFVVRQELGQNPTPDEWYARFPAWKADLEQMFQVHDVLCRAEESLQSRSLSGNGPARKDRPRQKFSVPGYVIQDEIGRGGMGVVYKAIQSALNRTVALKVILSGAHAGQKERDRFRREAESAARLDHPNVVRIYEVGEADGRPYCAMEYVGGGTLADRSPGHPWPAKRVAEFLGLLARAAHHAHDRGIIHRDLKPANVLLQPPELTGSRDTSSASDSTRTGPRISPDTPRPKIADFGLAKVLENSDAGPTRTGDLVGTPSYMAPEQASGNAGAVGPATDVWALGVLGYELLTGHLPFYGDSTAETLQLISRHEPLLPRQLRPNVPIDLQTICLKCLSKDPAARYASAADLADDIDRWLVGEPIRARPVGAVGRLRRWCGRNPKMAVLSGLAASLFVFALGAGGVAIVQQDAARRHAETIAHQEQDARQKEADERAHEQRRSARLQVAEGVRRLDEGDVSGAAVLFATALQNEPDAGRDEAHRIRLATSLRAVPTLRKSYWTDPGPRQFSTDGSTLLVHSPSAGLAAWETVTGARRSVPLADAPALPADAVLTSNGRAVVAVVGNRIRAWDTRTGRDVPLPLAPEMGRLYSPFAPDGRWRVGFGGADRTVLRLFKPDGVAFGEPMGFPQPIDRFQVSDHGGVVAGLGRVTVRVWDTDDGRPITPVLTFERFISRFQFSPSGRKLVVPEIDGVVHVFDTATAQDVEFRPQHSFGVIDVQFSPDESILYTSGSESGILSWSVKTGRNLGKGIAPNSRVGYFHPGSDGQTLLVENRDHTVRIWDAKGKFPHTPTLVHSADVSGRYAEDGRSLVTTSIDGAVRLWETRDPAGATSSHAHRGPVPSADWMPSGESVVCAGVDEVVEWDPHQNRPVRKYPLSNVKVVTVRRAGGEPVIAAGTTAGTVRVWDPRTGKAIGPDLPHPKGVTSLVFTARGILATGCDDGAVRFWDLATGTRVGDPLTTEYPIGKIRVSPDGRRAILIGKTNGLWDVPNARRIANLGPYASNLEPVFSPDGREVLVTDGAGRFDFLSTEDGRLSASQMAVGPWNERPTYSPDGRYLATACTAERAVQIWDVATGRRVGSPITRGSPNTTTLFSPDSRYLAVYSAGLNFSLQLWDVATGLPVTPAYLHGSFVTSLRFAPDGRKIMTSCNDGYVRVWDLTPDSRPVADILAHAQLLANRTMDDRGLLTPLSREEEQSLWNAAQAVK